MLFPYNSSRNLNFPLGSWDEEAKFNGVFRTQRERGLQICTRVIEIQEINPIPSLPVKLGYCQIHPVAPRLSVFFSHDKYRRSAV